MERTGRLVSGHPLLNRLFENIVWGQKDNFLEVPTDCPQRDERLGWTGDAQVFMGAACYQFRVLPFFRKWLRDMAAEQDDRGKVGHTVPDMMRIDPECSAGWGDAACICPWQLYRMYGDRETLAEEYPLMTGWIRYIIRSTTQPDLWIGGTHFGDWLAMDAPAGTRKGATDPDLIASAYYYYSTGLVIRAGRVLGEDVSAYEALAARSRAAFQRRFPDYPTQTACALAICFGLAADPLAVGRQLARLVQDNGNRLTTGFIGTPYLLHALHRTGHTELAYTLLLQEQFPSWLYSVKRGATTVWEHWDGINEQGELWDKNMNSFNHYAYGAVADWVFSVAAGIQPVEERPGFAAVRIESHPDRRLGMVNHYVVECGGVCGMAAQYNLRDFQLQCSEDGQQWHTVATVSDNTLSKVDAGIETVSARYFRLWITKANSAPGAEEQRSVVVSELRLYGMPDLAVRPTPADADPDNSGEDGWTEPAEDGAEDSSSAADDGRPSGTKRRRVVRRTVQTTVWVYVVIAGAAVLVSSGVVFLVVYCKKHRPTA